jgi:uncharacterized protein YdgA (DUF945 family)
VKKGVVALLVVLVLVVLVSPTIIGRLAEQGLNESLDWATQEQGDLVVTSNEFDRGWFTSNGQHRVELLPGELYDSILTVLTPAAINSLPVMLIDTRLDHGLIPVSSLSRKRGSLLPALGSAVSTLSVEIENGSALPMPGVYYSRVGLSGALESRFVLEPEGTDTDTGRVDWGGAEFLISADPAAGTVAVIGALDSIAVESDEETMIVGRVAVDVDLVDSGFGFMVGPVNMSVDSFALIGAENTMTAGPLNIESISSVDTGRVDSKLMFRVVNVPTPMGGTGGLDLVARIEKLDAAPIGRLLARLETARDSDFDELALAGLEQDALQLLASGLELHFDQLDIASPFGQISSQLSATVDRSDTADYTWASILMDLDASAEISLPAALVDLATQSNPEIHAAIGMGFIRKQGDFYVMKAAFKQGLLTVNGAPMPIPLSGLQ